MFTTLRNAWKIAELRKKLLFTIFIIVLYRFGSYIPIPFLDTTAIKTWLDNNSGTIFSYFDMLSGGAFGQGTLFALSISPYINASIIMQLLTIAIPALERLQKEGEEGRKKIAQMTRIATMAIAFLTGFGYYRSLVAFGIQNHVTTIAYDGYFTAVVILFTFTAGSAVLMWLAEQINDKGVGNGISIILFAGIVARGPAIINTVVENYKNGRLSWWSVLIILAVVVVVVGFVVFMSDAERRVPIQYAKRVSGRKMYGGQSTYLPIKVNMNGVLPIIFASSMVSIPATISKFLVPKTGSIWYKIVDQFSHTKPTYAVLYLLLIFGFSYFYTAVQYNPIELANNIKNNGGFIPGIRPGKPTSDFISRILAKITFFGGIFLSIVAILPIVFTMVTQVNIALGGTTLLIIVGVAIETMKQIESQMLMRHYKGFLD